MSSAPALLLFLGLAAAALSWVAYVVTLRTAHRPLPPAPSQRRGISVLSVDSPGVGEAIRFRGIPLRHDYEAAR